jgi:hypothetical protein
MLIASTAMAMNEHTTIVLHASDASFMPCSPVPFDCDATPPSIDVSAYTTGAAIWITLKNYEQIVGFQCAFDTEWVYQFGGFDCQGSQVNGTVPAAPFGPTSGTIATAFNAVTGGTIAPLGRMYFVVPASGCFSIVESSFPFGNHVVGPGSEVTPVIPENWGRLCVGPGGYDACVPFAPVPVERSTWGNVKNQYR